MLAPAALATSLQAILATTLLATATACTPPSDGPFANYDWGPDEYPAPATLGFNINHFSLLVGDLDASIAFYTDLLGMRRLFTYHGSEHFKIAYLGYPSGGRNGTGYQTPLELFRDKNNMQGLLEFVYIAPEITDPPAERPLASSVRTNSFSHVGLVVPDLDAARERFRENNITILADVGETPAPEHVLLIVNAYGAGLLPEGSEDVVEGMMQAMMGSGQDIMIIQDPDGNIIEVQPQF